MNYLHPKVYEATSAIPTYNALSKRSNPNRLNEN